MDQKIQEKRIKIFFDYGNTLKGAKVYYREDWQVYYFDLLGKMFGMMNREPSETAIITLKGLPEENEILREMYPDVIPGYYANKVHWNSIYLKTEQLSDPEIKKLILQSYKLVYHKLTKKAKAQIDAMQS